MAEDLKMESRTFPSLPQGLALTLKAIEQLMRGDGGFLADPECPYPDQTKLFLRRLIEPPRPGTGAAFEAVFVPGHSDEEQADSLINEIGNALNQMKTLSKEIDGHDVDMSDKLAYLKNYGGLMDRFLSLKERSHGLKQMYEFQKLVIEALTKHLGPDERLVFKQDLKIRLAASA